MRNQNHITNPKTIRRHEKAKEKWDEMALFAKENGYVTENRSTNSWSFSKDGVKSVLGFDDEYDVLVFIFKNKPDANKIFPPYKSIEP